MVLEKINQVGDIKQIPPEEYDTLAEEIWPPIWVW